jgi:hypothetical protein
MRDEWWIATVLVITACDAPVLGPPPRVTNVDELGMIAPGWTGEVIAVIDQSYAGWDVEIGDADADGRPEILTGSAPDSRVYRFDRQDGQWRSRVLADRMAHGDAGLVLGAHIVDLDLDGRPEIVVGNGREDGEVASLTVLRDDGKETTLIDEYVAPSNTSSYTHGLAAGDVDGDGLVEVFSAYCGNGEVIRYKPAPTDMHMRSHKVLQLSGSGEDVWLADVDGDDHPELIVANGFRDSAARVEIYDLNESGEPIRPPRVVLDRYQGHSPFYVSIAVGDVDTDGRPELIVGWKLRQTINRSSLVAYHIDGDSAEIAYVLADDDPELDLGYFEKMIAIDDVDGDGRNETIVSTRGDGISEGIWSAHLGRVYRYDVDDDGAVRRQTLIDFDEDIAESSWIAVGDADGDDVAELVIATGRGNRVDPGWSFVLALRPEPPDDDDDCAARDRRCDDPE